MWRILHIYFRARLHYIFSLKTKEAIAYHTLIKKHSYKLAQGDHQNIMIFGRFARTMFHLLSAKSTQYIVDSPNGIAVIDGKNAQHLARKKYLEPLCKEAPGIHIGRDALEYPRGIISKVSFLVCWSILFASILPQLFFWKLRGNYALILIEYLQWVNLVEIMKKEKIQHIHFFSSYEKDSNLISLLLIKNGIHVNRIPSSNLLSIYYDDTICNSFSYTAPFQRDERQKFTNWYVDEEKEFPCFSYLDLIKVERDSRDDTKKNVIGFVSSGVWRRKERGDLSQGNGEYESEEDLINNLNTYLDQNPELKLLIYLHPCERETEELHVRAKNIYGDIFQSDRLIFLDRKAPSFKHAYDCDIAVSVYSSANIERLFLGLKTLYAPSRFRNNIYGDTSMEKITCMSQGSLFERLDASSRMDSNEFFNTFGIEAYYHFGYSE